MNYGPVVFDHEGAHSVSHIDVVDKKDSDKVSFVAGMFVLAMLVVIAVVVIAALAGAFAQ